MELRGEQDLVLRTRLPALAAALAALAFAAPAGAATAPTAPVFDEDGWNVVALHHAGRPDMPRLDAEGTYEANEGIQIHAIRQKTQAM